MKKNNIDLSPDNSVKMYDNYLKKSIRMTLYPILNWITTIWLSKKFSTSKFRPNFWLWGQRGNDYPRLRARVNHYKKISNASIFIAGCGSGKDLPSWLKYKPKKIVGVDLFNYSKSWTRLIDLASKKYPKTNIQIFQGNLERLTNIEDATFDIVASDAVFEHLINLPKVLLEFNRILKPDGIIYATYGPMWHVWGGDHYSGNDGLSSGYNHLLLEDHEYKKYLNFEQSTVHSEDDGRTWIKENLFSYLRPQEYVDLLEKSGFQRLTVGAIVEPRAVAYAKKNTEEWNKLMDKHDTLDLILTGMTVIYQKNK